MKEFVVHTIPGSPFARAVFATLEEKGARYRVAPLTPQDMRGPRHLGLHPFGRMPILEHGDFRLYETQAILRYIDRVLPRPALTPTDPQLAARMDQLMNINDWYLFRDASAPIGFQRVVGPMLLGLAPDEAIIAAALPKAQLAFDELARLLSANAFVAGNALTLADLTIAPHLAMLSGTPEWAVLTRAHSHIVRWLARMNARDSMRATTPQRLTAMAQTIAQGSAMPKAS
jgi:glutathione S-transferase